MPIDLAGQYGNAPYDLTNVYQNWGVYYLYNSRSQTSSVFIPVPTAAGQRITILLDSGAFAAIDAIRATGGGAVFYPSPQYNGTSMLAGPAALLYTVNTLYGPDPPTGARTGAVVATYNQLSFDLVSANIGGSYFWCQY